LTEPTERGNGLPRARHLTPDEPRVFSTSRWRSLRRGVSLLVGVGAALVGVQLGVTGPSVSPVQPPTVAVSGTDDAAGTDAAAGPGTGIAPFGGPRGDDRLDRGRGGARGGPNGFGGGGRR
jgi:hypothetical protein